MRFKLLLVALVALSLLVACRPRPAQRMRVMTSARQNNSQSVTPTPAPKAAPKFVGIYKQLLIAADAPAIDSSLYVNVDGSFKLIDEYVGKATNTQVGVWQANADGSATITTTGQLERKFDKPLVTQARFTDDSQVTLQMGEAGNKGRQWIRFEALVADYTKAGYDAAATTKAIQQRGWAGLYKGALPAADCCGLDISLSLNVDKSATFQSDYLNGKAPIMEAGTWTASTTQTMTSTAPVTVTVTITGQQGQPKYDKPQVLQLALQNGVLVTTKVSTILPDGRLKLYSADGLLASVRAGLTDQKTTEQSPAITTLPHLQRHLPPWLRFLMHLDQLFHRWLHRHLLSHASLHRF